MRLPLFPLQTVLFPGATLPLHVFEPRYRELVGRCLEHDETFGIVLIAEGEEVGGPATPHAMGTEAAIVACQKRRDGRYDLVVEGRRRFEILELDRSRPLLRAEVRMLPEEDGEDATLAATVAALCEGLEDALELENVARRDEPWAALRAIALSYRVAAALPVPVEERQALLEMRRTDDRLRAEADTLMRVAKADARTRVT